MKRQESRRSFLKQTGYIAAAGTVLAGTVVPYVHAASNDTIKLAIVGCGGRGMGAARQALNADPQTKFWTVADVFPEKAQLAATDIKKDYENRDKGHMVDIAPDRVFSEFDGYKKAMDSLDTGDVVLLTTPSGFRPLHFAYAVERGLHVFAEKAIAVDIPGLKSLQESNKIARAKGLKIAVGLNNRHYFRTEEAVKEIHAGRLGDLNAFFVYRCQPPSTSNPGSSRQRDRDGQSSIQPPIQYQLRRTFRFNWLTGSYIVDALIHNLDICCWAKQQTPVAALGLGGRLYRREPDELNDNSSVQYTFADGKKMLLHTSNIAGTWAGFRAVIHGSKGCAVLGEGVTDPGFYEDWNDEPTGNPFWTPRSVRNTSHQTELDRFFKAIRENREWNELDYGIDATFTGILGRMAVETGQRVTAEEAWTSTFQYVPNIDELTLAGDAPVMPDAEGNYRIPRPGRATINNPYQE